MAAGGKNVRVGVFPAAEAARRPRLLRALAEAFPVEFEPREPGGWRDLEGGIVFGDDPTGAQAGTPVLLLPPAGQAPDAAPTTVRLAAARGLAPELRGRSYLDVLTGSLEPLREEVLAHHGTGAAWLLDENGGAPRTRVAAALGELGEEETLRDRLRPGRFLAMLALVQFLRDISGELAWQPPSLRACFLFDDPNLHWPTYGYLRFDELSRHAEEHRYHVSMAIVPLDGWLVHPAAARLFRERGAQLSLVVHGNDHVKRELARPCSDAEAAALLEEALRRVSALERRARVRVGRVMVPPHGACGEAVARTLVAAGFEALCISRPYPWLDRAPADRPLAGWLPTDLVAGGLPVLGRYPLAHPVEELPFRAFLRQPLISYGHHGDVAAGVEVLDERAAYVNGLGEVDWMSPAEIARTSVETRLEGATLRIRPHARRVEIAIPDGAEQAVVELPPGFDDGEQVSVATDAGEQLPRLADDPRSFEVRGLERVEVGLDRHRENAGVRRTRPKPWPLIRRTLAEGRDRALPHVRRAKALARR